MAKIILLLTFSFAFFMQQSFASNQDKNKEVEAIYHPLFNFEDNIRNKKLFNANIGIIYQLVNSNITSSARNPNFQSLDWGNSSFLGGAFQITVNITGKTWLRVDIEGGGMLNTNNGSSSVNSMINGQTGNYNANSSTGLASEYKAVLGHDFFSYKNIDFIGYGGLYNANLLNSVNMTGVVSSDNLSEVNSSSYMGAVFGAGINHYTDKMISNFFIEGYIASLKGYQKDAYNGVSISYDYQGSGASGGFGIGASTEIEMTKNVWIKPFVKFQMMFSGNLSFYNNNNNLQDYAGSANFTKTTLGLALSWR